MPTDMPHTDFDRVDQILAISRVLSRIPTGNPQRPYMGTPAPILASWATELHDDFGVRVHHDLAPKELVRVSSPLGNNGPVQAVTKGTPARVGDNPEVERMQAAHQVLMEWLHENDPDMARRVQEAQTDPGKAMILLQEITSSYPDLVAKINELNAQVAAETAGQ